MSGELEAAGALATAGAVAGAIEGREPGKPGEGACLNCGAQLIGPYCSQCGQHAHPHRKLTHVFEEFLHGIVHFDTKAWRTLPMVLFRPGTLTRNYVYGKRARYISPIALFLFAIFLMFFVFAFALPSSSIGVGNQPLTEISDAELSAQLRGAIDGEREMLAGAAEMRAQGLPDDGFAGGLDALREQRTAIEEEVRRRANQRGEAAPEPAASGVARAHSGEIASSATPEEEDRSLLSRLRGKFENPELAIYKLQQTAYKFSFLLAPLSLPFIALLFFWKRGVTLYDHMAYALYALSFASLLFIVLVLTAQHAWTNWAPGWLITIGLPVHTYFHLKGAYALGWFSALWRTFFMLTFALIILFIFLMLIVILGLAG